MVPAEAAERGVSGEARDNRNEAARLAMNLSAGGVDFGAVVEGGVPVAAALRGEVHEVPDGSEQVDAVLADSGAIQGCAV